MGKLKNIKLEYTDDPGQVVYLRRFYPGSEDGRSKNTEVILCESLLLGGMEGIPPTYVLKVLHPFQGGVRIKNYYVNFVPAGVSPGMSYLHHHIPDRILRVLCGSPEVSFFFQNLDSTAAKKLILLEENLRHMRKGGN